MSREIKFRGLQITSKKWLYGSLVQNVYNTRTSQEETRIRHQSKYDLEWYIDTVIPETVGQFTGLHDKHGKEIYEGDVVKAYNDIVYIKWDEEDFCFMGYINNDENHIYGRTMLNNICEVIGNIHEEEESK